MRRSMLPCMVVCLALAGGWLAACASQAGGPRAWIDRPLDGQPLPLGPVTLQAHAADADGLRAIEFRLDGEPIGEVAVDAVRFGTASLEWQPPAPGTYLLEVAALDTGGRRGAATRVTLVVTDGSLLSLPTPTAPPDVVITGVTCGPAYSVRVDFEVAGSLAVECIELFSTHATAAGSRLVFQAPYPSSVNDSLWLDEASADEIDRPHQVRLEVYYPNLEFPALAYAYEPGPGQRCPGHYAGEQALAATPGLQALWIARLNTNCRLGPGTAFDSQDVIESGAQAPIDGQNAEGTWFRVQPPGSSRTCWVSTASGAVQGDLSGVPVISVAPPATSTVAANQPPVIQAFDVSPGLILTEGSGCPAYSRTVTLSAVVSDDAGVASVVAQWTLGTLSGEAALLPAGGSSYTGSIGPVTQAGTMSITLTARDTSGAAAQSGPRSVDVQHCIE